jgi:dCTP deaminase
MAVGHPMIRSFNDPQGPGRGDLLQALNGGYDLLVADEFRIFTNVNSSLVGPDRKSLVVEAPSLLIPPNRLRAGKIGRVLQDPA